MRSTGKTQLTEGGSLQIEVPRDRGGSFEPNIVKDTITRIMDTVIKS